MKKTLFALLALGSLAMGKDVAISQLWDFKGSLLPGNNTINSLTVKDANELISATISSAYNFYGETWDTDISNYDKYFTGLDTKIGISGVEAAADTYISSSASITITLSGFTAGNKYNIALITGYASTQSGAWGNINSSNEKKGSITWIENSGMTWGSKAIQKSTPTGVYIEDMVADAKGNINLSINQGNHALGISALAITGTVTVPEPTTATLSLLALAGLAARRRRK